mmetsp:Transcript_8450/g.26872  ORF Transcript_8450/g.26872 Transcript_8450/m.26872 type:complete len:248 (+) Transcript_8450:48-791(+)
MPWPVRRPAAVHSPSHSPLTSDVLHWLVLLLVLVSGWLWIQRERLRRAWMWRGLRDVQSVLQTLAEPVIVMRSHTIVSVNKAALDAFGYSSCRELEGRPVTVLMQRHDAALHGSYVRRYEMTGEKQVIGKPRVVTGRRRDGSEVALMLSVSACATPGEYIGILYRQQEVEARKAAEAKLLQSELARLKMQVRAGGLLSPRHVSPVRRGARLFEAWTGAWRGAENAGTEASKQRASSPPERSSESIHR